MFQALITLIIIIIRSILIFGILFTLSAFVFLNVRIFTFILQRKFLHQLLRRIKDARSLSVANKTSRRLSVPFQGALFAKVMLTLCHDGSFEAFSAD